MTVPELEFILIIDRTYPWYPPLDDTGRESMGIDMSNAMFDRDLGQRIFDNVRRGAVLAEELGFDAVLLFEQHGHPLGMFGNNLMGAAWLAGQTRRIKLAAVGPLLNHYLSPVRLAEEIATVDMASGGRLIVGLPMGVGVQYHAMGVANPSHARARQREAIALLHRIWTEDGPFAWEGEFFHIPYVNVWPKPLQEPHPDVFIPAAGSLETLELAAKYRFTYQAVLTPGPRLLRNLQIFRDLCEQNGYTAEPRQVASVLAVHVAETDEQARRETGKHQLWASQNVIRFPFQEAFPPGHVSLKSFRDMMDGGYRSSDPSAVTLEQVTSGGLIGSPETVRENLERLTEEMGAGRVILATSFTEPQWLQQKSLTLFAEEVMPHFRRDGKATWQRQPPKAWETVSEFAAREPKPAGIPVVNIPGQGREEIY
jgi:alkanesulfonate monooxygenase SsuD/methylene tetrahydromethanopterin reductase-like flavin-dependent oxidoreductase (luciferase family)